MPPYSRYISKDFPIEGSFLRLDDAKQAWEQIDGRMRTAVRKAQQSGVRIEKSSGSDADIAAFREFCLNPDDLPEQWTDRYHLYLAHLDSTIVAGIIIVEVGTKLFMLCHASTPEAKKANIPALLIWHIVEQFAGKQFDHLDVGASYRPSLQSFFSGWRTKGYPIVMKAPELKPTLMLTPFDNAALDTPTGPKPPLFDGRPSTFFPRAMYAIFTLIKSLKIPADGEVWITTTTDTHYISSCVTSAIEKSAVWSRELSSNTRAIFAIHEFGFPHPRLHELRAIATERGMPLIEDCAYGWHTDGIGQVGDYAIYSLTKAFPVQFGGYLVGRAFSDEELWNDYACSDTGKRDYVESRLGHWLAHGAEAKKQRRTNYAWYADLFGDKRTYFPLADSAEPGAYILKIDEEERMKTTSAFVREFGIECGNYWQNSAIILPVHQRLSSAHLAYIAGAALATEREWCGVPLHP